MKKAQEKKLLKAIEKEIGDELTDSKRILIQDLIDWIKISDYCKNELAEYVKENENLNWQTMTKLSMASKQIQSILKNLGLTVVANGKKEEPREGKFDIAKFLNEN